jgi:hypothetical protein
LLSFLTINIGQIKPEGQVSSGHAWYSLHCGAGNHSTGGYSTRHPGIEMTNPKIVFSVKKNLAVSGLQYEYGSFTKS